MKSLRKLRVERGWSQAELGRRSRIHPSDISRFESGRAVPYPVQAEKLAAALGVEIADLSPVQHVLAKGFRETER